MEDAANLIQFITFGGILIILKKSYANLNNLEQILIYYTKLKEIQYEFCKKDL